MDFFPDVMRARNTESMRLWSARICHDTQFASSTGDKSVILSPVCSKDGTTSRSTHSSPPSFSPKTHKLCIVRKETGHGDAPRSKDAWPSQNPSAKRRAPSLYAFGEQLLWTISARICPTTNLMRLWSNMFGTCCSPPSSCAFGAPLPRDRGRMSKPRRQNVSQQLFSNLSGRPFSSPPSGRPFSNPHEQPFNNQAHAPLERC